MMPDSRIVEIFAISLAQEFKGKKMHEIETALYDRVFRVAAGNADALEFAGTMARKIMSQKTYP